VKNLRAEPKTLFDLLCPEVLRKIRYAGSRRSYSADQVIQQRGDQDRGLSIVETGQVAAGNVGLDGSFLFSALLGRGECFGELTLFAGLPRTQNIAALEDTEITSISEKNFLPLFDTEPSIPRALLTITLLRNHELVEVLDDQRRLSLPTRICKLLLNGKETNSKTAYVECRQEDLAFMLGVSRVSVGKALKRLQNDELVTLEYGRILLPNVERLIETVDNENQILPIS
jgi:CRP/FNR family transcriptional regulator, cyclic AMP receptor protein